MVLYRVLDNGHPVKRNLSKLPGAATLIGWDDEGGDPVFVAVLSSRNPEWGIPHPDVASNCAGREMRRRLNQSMGAPHYIMKGFTC